MITVVMLNWARPQFALQNMIRYATYGSVEQILCFNNGARLAGATRLPRKCVLVESSADLGVSSRLAVASLATTEAVFHTDDDISVPEATMEALHERWRCAKQSCHGLFGRIAYPTYALGNVNGPAEVILTRAVMCSRRVNNLALAATELFQDLTCKPRGNGEDIILSFAAMAASGKLNCAYRLPATNYPGCDNGGIHKRWPGHVAHRGLVVARCRQVFFGPKA